MSARSRSPVALIDRLDQLNRYQVAALLLALASGALVFLIASEVFPYHSSNHDEAVYLQQAAMLLDGQLFLRPGSDAMREAVHPWFFVESPRGFYPKYSPVAAAVFAVGKLAGGYRLALGGIAALNVALVYGIAGAAFDRRTGLLAALLFAAAPLFLLTSAVFLPYAPTTALNLTFALAYLRAARHDDVRYAGLAGVAIGLAFFARPYTAVLFAAPFIGHALWRVSTAVPERLAELRRYVVIAAGGATFVLVTFGYNAVVTGSPFLFPYEAFAPLDGLGFGQRAILGYELVYTPELALRVNGIVVWMFATRWFTAGLLGTGVALIGLVAVGRGLYRAGLDPGEELGSRQLQLLLVGVAVSVIVGNVFFWGNRNILADLGQPGDGLVSLFGPFYHFDLLLPTAALAAHGAITGVSVLRDQLPPSTIATRVGLAVLVLTAIPLAAVAQADALGPPLERNQAYTAKYAEAYAPFEPSGPADAVVFLPPTYGEWRNHPFQWLRNDPDFDGPTVYVLSRNVPADFSVLDRYPERTVYRYRYHGEWTPDPSERVVPVLERLTRLRGSSVVARTTIRVPDRIIAVSVALSDGSETHRWDYAGEPPKSLTLNWTLGETGATLNHTQLRSSGDDGDPTVPIQEPTELVLAITITEPSGATLTYREAVLVRPAAAGIEALWPPATSTCLMATSCGLEGTYVPDRPDTRPSGIELNTTLVEVQP